MRQLSGLMVIMAALLISACDSERAAAPAAPPNAPKPAPAATEPAPPPEPAPPAPSATPAETETPAAETVADLSGTVWQLVRIQSMDDTVTEPAPDAVFSISFQADGRAALQVHCNRGMGKWLSASQGQLRFGPLAVTRKMCAAESIDGRFLKELDFVRSYVLRDGQLYLATMADGSIIEFAPSADQGQQRED
ncbi:META domain-containing protein [Parahaliea maris]|nr:META domain-containing protein [Parahaliea maris]